MINRVENIWLFGKFCIILLSDSMKNALLKRNLLFNLLLTKYFIE